MIKRYEANTLEEACSLAVKDLNIPIDKLEYEIIQYPSKGILGLFSKKAVIVVANNIVENSEHNQENFAKSLKESKTNEVVSKEELLNSDEKEIFDSFYGKGNSNILNNSYDSIDAKSLEDEIKKLMSYSCFNLDTIEVDIEDNTAYVFIDGDDAALLIGKEGYRYNALSYLLFNWINAKYGLYLKLEIAQFLASQQDMIKHQLQPVIEHVKKEGWGRTKELDGILVQIALEYLRDVFPNKYVAIKKNISSGERYIVINEFNKR